MKKGGSPVSDTASGGSQKVRKPADGVKLQADSSTSKGSEHLKVYESFSPNCGCPNQREAFFDKLLNYLEKQSDVITRCCFDDRNVRNKRLNTDPNFDKEESPCSNNSPFDKSKICKDEDKMIRGKPKDECKIVIEVCTCDKDKNTVQPSTSSRSVKSRDRNPTDASKNYEIHRGTANETDCSGCDKKVDTFFKLAEEICQVYLKRCLMNGSKYTRSEETVAKGKRGYRRGQEDRERVDERDSRDPNSVAVEIDCHGDREESTIQQCSCRLKSNQAPSLSAPRTNQEETRTGGRSQGQTKCCIEMFEERYGQLLRDLHSKLIKHNSQPDAPQQQYPAPQQPQQPPYQTPPQQSTDQEQNNKPIKPGKGKNKKKNSWM